MEIQGYEVLGEVSRRPGHVLYRAVRAEDQKAVLLKAPVADPPSAADVESLESEYAILKELTLPGVPGSLDLLREGRRRVLVLEDVGALPLAVLPSWSRPELTSLLTLAIQLTEILAELHRREMVHKNINPWSIYLKPSDGRAYLTDFSLASRTTEADSGPIAPNRLRGTLPYLSPEQTGRMTASAITARISIRSA